MSPQSGSCNSVSLWSKTLQTTQITKVNSKESSFWAALYLLKEWMWVAHYLWTLSHYLVVARWVCFISMSIALSWNISSVLECLAVCLLSHLSQLPASNQPTHSRTTSAGRWGDDFLRFYIPLVECVLLFAEVGACGGAFESC